MLISAIVHVLHEALEAALLVSVLFSLAPRATGARRAFIVALLVGAAMAALHSSLMGQVSEWFDYRGQEIGNVILHLGIATMVALYCRQLGSRSFTDRAMLMLSCGALALVMVREGSEVITYLWGNLAHVNNPKALVGGSMIGLSIGISIGVLLYQFLLNIPLRQAARVVRLLLAIFTGNMLAQAVVQLHQSGLLGNAVSVWDSSHLLSESSLVGQLLYSLIGYEATPSLYQLGAYVFGVVIVLVISRGGDKISPNKAKIIVSEQ